MIRCLTLALVVSATLVGLAWGDDAPQSRHRLPEKFTPVDTSRVLGSPDPLPLEAAKAFPQLKFERPVEITHAGDGTNRLFVVEQKGVIRVFKNDPQADEAGTFLDISEVVLREGNEEGLLGLAFHPQFKQNGEFFVYYSTKPRTSVISRFKVAKNDANKADRASEQKLLELPQPYPNHNGGSLKFGHDGCLYIGLGDGGLRDDPHGNAQNLATLLGSILRIDVDRRDEGLAYAIPKDNPFAGRSDARGEIWAYGFRNVWRLGVDRKTGQLWAGDVGQDRFEEVNLVERGGNYGWNLREGMHDFQPNTAEKPHGLIDPLAEYFRGEGGSVTGGIVYRGPSLSKKSRESSANDDPPKGPETAAKGPSAELDYNGAYFYGDYLSGNVWALWLDEHNQARHKRQVARTNLGIAAFGDDEAGEMYLCAFDGHIYKLQPREIDRDAVAKAFPRKLSETGLFASVANNEPVEGMIPYDLNMPFWSDYAVKDRYIALPKGDEVKFSEREKWQFPAGTVFVKTFWMHRDRVNLKDPVRLETRLLVNGDEGWVGYTYVYNDDQSEAYLLDDWLTKPVRIKGEKGEFDQIYYFPSQTDCLTCHTKQEGFVLGLTTRQMNRTLHYRGQSEPQIELLNRLGVFTKDSSPSPRRDEDGPDNSSPSPRPGEGRPSNPSPSPLQGEGRGEGPPRRETRNEEKPSSPSAENLEAFPDWQFGNFDRSGEGKVTNTLDSPEGDIEKLARAWLEVNCANCHRPEGISPLKRDLRYHTPLEKMGLVDEAPKQGQLRPKGTVLVDPGQPDDSELLFRLGRRGPRQMPPLATHHVDPRGYEVVRKWIEGMGK